MQKYALFLRILFVEVGKRIDIFKESNEDIAIQWYDWLNNGASIDRVSMNRRQLYYGIVQKTKEVCFTSYDISYNSDAYNRTGTIVN